MADEITLTLEEPYIGSAYSPQVTVEEIEGGHAVTITSDVPGEGIVAQTFDVLDGDASQAIEDAEAAAAAARAAAASASSAATSATNAATAASTAAGQASTAAGAATDAASAATGAAASASAAAADATEAAGLADDATAAATAAASNAGTATREAIAATTGANNAAASANAAAGSATDAATAATTAAGTATDAAAAATSAASAAGTAADAANTAATAANAAAEAATEAAEGVTDAYLPRVTVGAADGITGGGPLDTAAWLQRACPGSDGPARIESIHGRTVVWNQGIESDLSIPNGVRIITGHKYYFAGTFVVSGTTTGTPYESVYTRQSGTNSRVVDLLSPGGTSGGTFRGSKIFTSTVDAIANGRNVEGSIWLYAHDQGATVTYTDFMLIDLTQVFGSGNEPSSVAEFEQMYPEACYPYDAGSLQPVRMTGVESVGDGWTFQRAIDAGVLRGAGTVYDELTADEHIVRVGEVDLGTLTWTYNPNWNGGPAFAAMITGNEQAQPQNVANIQCSKYETVSRNYLYNNPTSTGISLYNSSLSVRDPAYTDAATFKASVGGYMLHYALATPTTTPIDPALNLTYKAAQGGNERVMHSEPTAPPTLVIQYGSTADGIRDRALEAIAAHDGPVAQTYHAVGTYLTLDGTLYKVTTAIAAGERITAGTNVVATTVMAEVIALTQ